jgi:hypothetical protein
MCESPFLLLLPRREAAGDILFFFSMDENGEKTALYIRVTCRDTIGRPTLPTRQ